MIRFGIELNTIPREEPERKAIIPIEEPIPLAIISPQPHCYGQSYFAQPIRSKTLLLEGALSVGTNILPPKHNEKLLGVKTNQKGKVVCSKYTTSERAYFEGVHTHPSKVNFIPQRKL